MPMASVWLDISNQRNPDSFTSSEGYILKYNNFSDGPTYDNEVAIYINHLYSGVWGSSELSHERSVICATKSKSEIEIKFFSSSLIQ